jgi:hypothetical protein
MFKIQTRLITKYFRKFKKNKIKFTKLYNINNIILKNY